MTILDKEIDLWTAFCEEALRKVRHATVNQEPHLIKLHEANKRVLEAMLELKVLQNKI